MVETTKKNEKPREEERTLSVQQVRELQQAERRKLNELIRRRKGAENMLLENQSVRESVDAISDEKEMTSIMPLGAGVFVEGKIAPNTFKRMLAGNVVLNAPREDVVKELEERKALLEKEMEVVDQDIQTTSTNLNGINQVLQTIRQARQTKAQK
ncbi:MAG: hypothetical protein Q8P05_00395 [Candidatus Diapherotrites archaeon]|nr:hypothetical protein [Candidatus Diapherotrites archaeon]MDZ4256552.1 hypothetical protein [archaeon]